MTVPVEKIHVRIAIDDSQMIVIAQGVESGKILSSKAYDIGDLPPDLSCWIHYWEQQ